MSVVAASELPPPRPAPVGKCFSRLIETPIRQSVFARSNRAARMQRSFDSGEISAGAVDAEIAPSSLRSNKTQIIAAINESKRGLQQMVTVRATANDMKNKFSLAGAG